jgi:hypothetical protein
MDERHFFAIQAIPLMGRDWPSGWSRSFLFLAGGCELATAD